MGTPRTIRSAATSSSIRASDSASVSFCSADLLSAGVVVATIHSSVRKGSEPFARSRSMMRPFGFLSQPVFADMPGQPAGDGVAARTGVDDQESIHVAPLDVL